MVREVATKPQREAARLALLDGLRESGVDRAMLVSVDERVVADTVAFQSGRPFVEPELLRRAHALQRAVALTVIDERL
jgi:hypothetical protein